MNNTIRMLWIVISLAIIAGPSITHSYEVVEVKEGGALKGQVTFSGHSPEPLQFAVEKNPEVCGDQRSLVKVEVQNGLLKGAVVILEGIKSGKPFGKQLFPGSAPGRGTFQHTGGVTLGLEVSTENCNFGPFTGVVAPDEDVRFRNKDSVKHVLHTFVSMNAKGNILRTLHNRDIQPERTFDRTFDSGKLKDSRLVRLTCNRHDFMQNWLYVVSNPYFAITNDKGEFAIKDIPSGHYTLRAWHPMLGLQERKVQVKSGAILAADFSFSE